MPYGPIEKTENLSNIAAQQYAVGHSLVVTPSTVRTCLAGRVGDTENILVIHLVHSGSEGALFDDVAADRVEEILVQEGVAGDRVCMVGQVDSWRLDYPPGFSRLFAVLRKPWDDRLIKTEDNQPIEFSFDANARYGFSYKVGTAP